MGLHGICITDHDGHPPIQEAASLSKKMGLLVLPGMEVLTLQGDFLVFGLERRPPHLLEAQDLVSLVSSQGGITIGAHPYRNNGRGAGDQLKTLKNLTAIESFNGNTLPKENLKAVQLGKELSLPCMGGSDAHQRNEIGRFASYFPDRIHNLDSFIAAIKKGRVYPVGQQKRSFTKEGSPLSALKQRAAKS